MSDDNVTYLRTVANEDPVELLADDCLKEAIDRGMQTVVVCGVGNDGHMYVDSNVSDGRALLIMEQIKALIVMGTLEDRE